MKQLSASSSANSSGTSAAQGTARFCSFAAHAERLSSSMPKAWYLHRAQGLAFWLAESVQRPHFNSKGHKGICRAKSLTAQLLPKRFQE